MTAYRRRSRLGCHVPESLYEPYLKCVCMECPVECHIEFTELGLWPGADICLTACVCVGGMRGHERE